MAGDKTDIILMKLKSFILEAKFHAPSIIIFDDIDAICPIEHEDMFPDPNVRVLASVFIDMISKLKLLDSQDICIIVTCKNVDNIHQIIQRSGLFETRVHLPVLTRNERMHVSQINLKRKNPPFFFIFFLIDLYSYSLIQVIQNDTAKKLQQSAE